MNASLSSMYCFSQGNFQSVIFAAMPWNEKFIEPMLSEHISGLNLSEAASRCSTVISGLPPVVRLMTASVEAWIWGRNCANTSGSPVGEPSLGLRACRCRIAAPALAASMACWAMSAGVYGSAADSVGVWIAPVTAQVMMILFDGLAMVVSGNVRDRLSQSL